MRNNPSLHCGRCSLSMGAEIEMSAIPKGYIERDGELHKAPSQSAPLESELHQSIEAYCKQRRWYYVHSRMDARTTTAKGVPDFIIALPSGRTLWIECKRKGGKPTSEQLGAHQWLRSLSHEARIVWTFDEFIEATEAQRIP